MTGKLADVVMAVRNGEQVARKYQPIVFNPSTAAQVAQRAKLKALSQLSAVMASVIAIPKQGPVSSRNLFTKLNFPNVSYADNTASVNLVNIRLTSGILSLPAVSMTRASNVLTISLASTDSLDVNRVVYAVFARQDDGTLRLAKSIVVSTPGTGNTYQATMDADPTVNDYLVLGYGVRENNENARARLANVEVPTAEYIAKLVVSRTLTESDVTLTETRGALQIPA